MFSDNLKIIEMSPEQVDNTTLKNERNYDIFHFLSHF